MAKNYIERGKGINEIYLSSFQYDFLNGGKYI